MGKITVITGSPRKGGNSDILADSFIAAAEAKGHTIERFDAGRLTIGGCHACNTCFKTGNPCTFNNDDFNPIARSVQTSDAVIFAMPTYWFSVPSNIKGVLDRLYCFIPSGKLEEIKGKKAAVFASCMDGLDAMDAIVMTFRKSFALLGWENLGEVLVPNAGDQGTVRDTDGPARTAALADLI